MKAEHDDPFLILPQQQHQQQQQTRGTTTTASKKYQGGFAAFDSNISSKKSLNSINNSKKDYLDQESCRTEATTSTLTSFESGASSKKSNSSLRERRSNGRLGSGGVRRRRSSKNHLEGGGDNSNNNSNNNSSSSPLFDFGVDGDEFEDDDEGIFDAAIMGLDGSSGGLEDFPDADFSRTLDEAFGSGPRSGTPSRTKSGSHHRPRRTRSPAGGGDRSVGSLESNGSGGASGAGGGSGGRGPSGRGIAQQRSQRRAGAATAIHLMAAGDDDDDHVAAPRAERRSSRRSKTHEDRLHAATMMCPMGSVNRAVEHDYADESNEYGSHGDRHGRGHNRRHSHQRDMAFDDSDPDESENADIQQHRHEKQRATRRPRRANSDDVGESHHHYNEEADRRTRFTGKGPIKSFDEGMGAMRARGRRRSSMIATSGGGGQAEEDLNPGGALRARRSRRFSLAVGDGTGAGMMRPEPLSRGVPSNRSMGRARRTPLAVAPDVQDYLSAGGASDADLMDQSQQDDEYISAEKQEWQEKRADKQKAMLERLRKAKEETATADEGNSEEPEEEPPAAPEPRSRGRRTSIGILGMSTTNFSSVEDDAAAARKDEKERKKDGKAKLKADKADKKKTPGRSKSTEGGIPTSAAPPVRTRTADRDRRRPGTMLDRIGA